MSTQALTAPSGAKRVLFTGQVGVDKSGFIQEIAGRIATLGHQAPIVEHTGTLMYAEDPSIPAGEILNIDRGRLRALRRGIMRDVIQRAKGAERVLLNSHASFRWSNGMFAAQDADHLGEFAPQLVIDVVDNFHAVWARLQAHSSAKHSMADVLIAREAEQLASQMLAAFVAGGPVPLFIAARGPNNRRVGAMAELIAGSKKRTVYPSFPMTHVAKMPDVLELIDEFRELMAQHFIVFDPGDVDEKGVIAQAKEARAQGLKEIPFEHDGRVTMLPVNELISVEGEVDRQICERDYLLIDQSDMIVSVVPELSDGMPALSSGVERELQHAFFTGKSVFVLWLPARDPSPFISNQVTAWYRSKEAMLEDFAKRGYLS